MYLVLFLSVAFLFSGICLLTYDLAKKKREYEDKWLDNNVWKDTTEWEAYRSKQRAVRVDLSF